MLGISVYLGSESISGLESYIQKVRDFGFTSIFTSLHIPEDDPALYKKKLRELGMLALKYEMELMADISPHSLGHLGFSWDDAEGLLEWGVSGLRVDYGIAEDVIVWLSTKMKVALNASTLTREGLDRLKRAGLKLQSVEAWHNFYPRRETGLDAEEFTKVNRWIKAEGITVMAFIPGDDQLRGPLYEGLPTLEDHREMSPFVSYIDLVENRCVHKVLVGDLTLAEDTLHQFAAYKDGVMMLRAEHAVNNKSLLKSLETVQTNRRDSARDCIRSIESRRFGLIEARQIPAFNTVERPIGSITVDNENYGRYEGEIQITKRDLPADEKVNVIGRIIKKDRVLLRNIRGGAKFQIKWKANKGDMLF